MCGKTKSQVGFDPVRVKMQHRDCTANAGI